MAETPRPLSLRQAQSCENALHKTCKCRCGGRLHGAKRGGQVVPGEAFFAALPEDDPHYRPTDARRAEARRLEREAAQHRKWDLLSRLGAWRRADHEAPAAAPGQEGAG